MRTMRDKLRQRLVDSPRAMTAAYVVLSAGVTFGSTLVEAQEAAGGTVGP